MVSDCRKYGGQPAVRRKLRFCRFWKIDDDGIFLISFNSTTQYDELPSSVSVSDINTTTTSTSTGVMEVSLAGAGGGVHAALHESKNSNNQPSTPPSSSATTTTTNTTTTASATATASVKTLPPVSVDAVFTISPRKDNFEYDTDYKESLVRCTCQVSTEGWAQGELETFVTNFLKQHLLELNQNLLSKKFPTYMGVNVGSQSHHNSSNAGSYSPTHPSSDPMNMSMNTSNSTHCRTTTPPATSTRMPDYNISPIQTQGPNSHINSNSASSPSSKSNTSGASSAIKPSFADLKATGNSMMTMTNSAAALGVTTRQPDNDSTHNPPKAPSTRRFMFRRNKPTTSTDDSYLYSSPFRLKNPSPTPGNVHMNTLSNATTTSATSTALGQSRSTHNTSTSTADNIIVPLPHEQRQQKQSISRSKSQRTKEANQLRQNIAMKEYVLKRLQKEISRSKSNSQAQAMVNQDKESTLYSQTKDTLSEHVSILVLEINELKDKYLTMTGKPFEHSVFDRTRRRPASIKNYLSTRANAIDNNKLTINTYNRDDRDNDYSYRAADLGSTIYNHEDLSGRRGIGSSQETMRSATQVSVPPHWLLPVRQLRFDFVYDDDDDNEIGTSNNSKDAPSKNKIRRSYSSSAELATAMSMNNGLSTKSGTNSGGELFLPKNEFHVTLSLFIWIVLSVIATLLCSELLSSL